VRLGRNIVLITAFIGLAGVAAVYLPSWKSADDGVVRILPLVARIDIDHLGAPSWDGRFVPYRNNQAQLWLYNVGTTQTQRVLDRPQNARQNFQHFLISPDGSQVAYLLESLDGASQLKILNADGSGERLLFADPKYLVVNPTSWSTDGRSIAAILSEKEDVSSVGVINVSDGSLRILYGNKSVTNAKFSPDGRFVAYEEARDVFAVSSAGGPPIPVVLHPANDTLFGWAPDGRLAFRSDRSGKNDIWTVEFQDGKVGPAPRVLWQDFNFTPLGITKAGDFYYNRSEIRNQLYAAEVDSAGGLLAPPAGTGNTRTEGKNKAPDYSPDGTFLAYVSELKESQELRVHIRTLANGAERDLPLPMPRVDQIRWYPDNSAILIRGGGSNHYGLYRLELNKDIDKSGKLTAVLTEGIGNYPAVNPTFSLDGRYLYYMALPSPDAAVLMRLDLSNGVLKEVLRPQQGFLRMFSLSPDGTQIVYDVRPPGTSRDQIYVAPLSGGQSKLLRESDSVRAWGGLAWADRKTVLFHHPDSYGVRLDDLLRVSLNGDPVQTLASTSAVIRIAMHPDGRHITWESQEWRDELLSIHNLFIKNPTFKQP